MTFIRLLKGLLRRRASTQLHQSPDLSAADSRECASESDLKKIAFTRFDEIQTRIACEDAERFGPPAQNTLPLLPWSALMKYLGRMQACDAEALAMFHDDLAGGFQGFERATKTCATSLEALDFFQDALNGQFQLPFQRGEIVLLHRLQFFLDAREGKGGRLVHLLLPCGFPEAGLRATYELFIRERP